MAQQVINIGTTADDGTGESLRSALDKTNDNFTETYTRIGTAEADVVALENVLVVSVFYDAGWPATRPTADTVLAVGHTVAPTWLTANDIWFEATA